MQSLISGRTKYVTAFAVLVVAAVFVLTRQSVTGAETARLIGSYTLVGFPLFAAAASWWCASQMAAQQMRIQWLLLGGAAFAFGTGQFLEEFLHLISDGLTVAKLLYMVAIITFGAGTWTALRSFDGFLDLHGPLRTSMVAAALATLVMIVGLAGFLTVMDAVLIDKILLAAYPIALLWLMAMPGFALALTVSQMGSGSLARPWWAVFGGVMLLTMSNVILVITNALGIPITNTGPMEMGWWIGLSLIAIGATMQIDVQKPTAHASVQVN